MSELPPIILSDDEIRAITGAVAPTVQFNELKRLGFTRVRRGLDRSLILERAHYEAVCAGSIVLPPAKLLKAVDALARNPVHPPAASVAALTTTTTPTPPAAPNIPSNVKAKPQKITLEEWAARNYSRPISRITLGKWRREGQIYPPPERVWPHWMVNPDARRDVSGLPPNYVPLVDRLKAR